MRIKAISTFLVLQLRVALSLIGYDCATPNTNITTISLNSIGGCDIPEPKTRNTTLNIQLLQILDMGSISVKSCKIEVLRQVLYCGMNSHSSAVAGGLAEYIKETPKDQCQGLHETGRLHIGSSTIDGLRSNHTTTSTIVLAGKITTDGSCLGTYYSDPYGSWDNVVVQATLKITLMDYSARSHLQDNQVSLLSGTRCSLNIGSCVDLNGGYTFWDPLPQDTCHFDRYAVLYQGYASKLEDKSFRYSEIIYTVVTQDITFALTSKERHPVCGYQLIKTEHPKLFILEETGSAFFNKKKPTSTQDLDLFTYINSKFVYVERHIRTQMNGLYRDILYHRCKLQQEMLRTSQTLAIIKPDEFAFNYHEGPGYTAIVTGEVIRLIKCTPVEVAVSSSKNCYQELPVKRGNSTWFLTPRTHILKTRGFQVPCNTLLPPMYNVDGVWYKMLPFPSEAKEPHVLSPRKEPTWTYQNPGNLARQGIYTEEDLEKLRDYIMSPVEQPAIINNIVRVATGEDPETHGLNFGNFLDAQALESIARSTWEKFWGGFSRFGIFSAGIMGIVLAVKFAKYIIDTLIHVFALQAVFGWSFYLLGAVMDSLTNALLHLKNRKDKQASTNEPDTPSRLLEEVRIKSTPSTVYPTEELAKVIVHDDESRTPPEDQSTSSPRLYGLK